MCDLDWLIAYLIARSLSGAVESMVGEALGGECTIPSLFS